MCFVFNIHPSQDAAESVTTENKNMMEALTKARHDNEELQEAVVLKEVKTLFSFCAFVAYCFSFSLYYTSCIFICL